MNGDRFRNDSAASPFDPYIRQALNLIADSGDVSSSGLSRLCSSRLGWLPGFCDVILSILRTNRLIVVNEWEPGKVHISHRGRRWIDTSVLSS